MIVAHDFVEKLIFSSQVIFWCQLRKVGDVGRIPSKRCACVYALHFRLGDGEGVITDGIGDAFPVILGFVSVDYIAIFQMNYFARSRCYEPRSQGKPDGRDDKCAHSGAF